MPKRRDAVTDFLAHQERVKQLKSQGAALKREAARFLGELVLDAGLASWSVSDLKAGLARLSEEGPRRPMETANGSAAKLAASVEPGGAATPPTRASGA